MRQLSACLSVLRFGTRFPCMSDAYSKDLRRLAGQICSELGCSGFLREGVYCMVSGPNFETIAEARMLQVLGCDSVGKTGGQTGGQTGVQTGGQTEGQTGGQTGG